MAPEQTLGRRGVLSPGTDVYGLGAVLYELLTGRPPFRGATVLETLEQVRTREPVPVRQLQPKVPRDLETICLKCLEKEPCRRYATAGALADDLKRFEDGEPIQARTAGPVERLWRKCRRKPLAASLVAALVLTLVGGFSVSLFYWLQTLDLLYKEEEARREAEASQARILHILTNFAQLGENHSPVPNQPWEFHIAMLRQVEDHYQRLLRQRPQDPVLRQALANTYLGLEWIDDASGRHKEALTLYQATVDLWQQLVHQDGRNLAYRAGLARASYLLGRASARQYDTPHYLQALDAFRQACSQWQAVVEEQPTFTNRQGLARSLQQRGLHLWGMGRPGEAITSLEASRVLLDPLVRAKPSDRLCRTELANACRYLGELRRQDRSPNEASHYWQQAYEHYQKLVEEVPEYAVFKMFLAQCCLELMQGRAADPYYAEAVQQFEQAIEGLARQLAQDPTDGYTRTNLVQSARRLAECHLKAGQIDKAALAFGHIEQFVSQDVPAARQLEFLCLAAGQYWELRQPAAALAKARQAAALLAQDRRAAIGTVEERFQLNRYLITIARLIRQAGEPAEALRLAEQAKRLFSDLVRQAPKEHRYGFELFQAWEQVGKAYIQLDQPERAVKAWRQGIEVARRVIEQAPTIYQYRVSLGERYLGLSRHSHGKNRLAEAEAWLRELEMLRPDNADTLLTVAQELKKLAEAVGQGCSLLTPAEQAERRHYLDQSDRVATTAAELQAKNLDPRE
jgi:tetratricopeptide (TPR) repeat protein